MTGMAGWRSSVGRARVLLTPARKGWLFAFWGPVAAGVPEGLHSSHYKGLQNP